METEEKKLPEGITNILRAAADEELVPTGTAKDVMDEASLNAITNILSSALTESQVDNGVPQGAQEPVRSWVLAVIDEQLSKIPEESRVAVETALWSRLFSVPLVEGQRKSDLQRRVQALVNNCIDASSRSASVIATPVQESLVVGQEYLINQGDTYQVGKLLSLREGKATVRTDRGKKVVSVESLAVPDVSDDLLEILDSAIDGDFESTVDELLDRMS